MQNEDEDTNNGGGKSNNSKAANLAAVKKSAFGNKNAEDAELNGKDNDDQQVNFTRENAITFISFYLN